MKLKNICISVVAGLCILVGHAHAQSLGSTTVTTTGHGATEKDAIHDALVMAVSQVRGLSIQSQEYLSIQDTIRNDSASNLTQYKNDISTQTKGLVSSYTVNQSSKNAQTGYQVTVTAVVPTYKASQQINRLRLAVLPLKIAPQLAGNSSAINAGHEWMAKLEDSLVQTRRFAMLDRSYAEQTRAELNQYLSGEFNPAEVARIGQKAGTDYIVTGEVMKYQVQDKSVRNPLTGERIARSSLDSEISLRVIDVATSQVKFAKTYGSPQQASVDIINAIYPLMAVAVSPMSITIGQGGDALKVGQKFDVFALGRELKDPYTGESLGKQEVLVGQVQIASTQFKTSEARILSGSEQINANFANGLVLRQVQVEQKPVQAKKTKVSEDKW